MRRRWTLVAVALIALDLLLWHCQRPQFTEAMSRRTRRGMTQAQVEAILGRTAGDYTGGAVVLPATWPAEARGRASVIYASPDGFEDTDGQTCKRWVSDQAVVEICFGRDGRVIECHREPVRIPAPEGFLDLPSWAVRLLLR